MGMVLFATVIASAQQDMKAKNILDEVSKKAQSNTTISADFIFTMQNKEMEINEKNEGTIKLKGKKYVVDLPDIGVKVFSDGKTVWSYMKDGNQVTVSNIDDQSNELMDPSSLFSIYEKGFKSKYVGEKKEGNKIYDQIDLFPEKEDVQDVSKVTILIDKLTMMIHSAEMYTTDDNIYGVLVKKMETDKNYPDSDFVFNPSDYNDVEVIDLR
jgi:outer membrane lipoprotein-sorting protein